MSSSHEDTSHLSAPSPNLSNSGSNETFFDPSPIAPSSNGTEFTDLDETVEQQQQAANTNGPTDVVGSRDHTTQPPELVVRRERNAHGVTLELIGLELDSNVHVQAYPFST